MRYVAFQFTLKIDDILLCHHMLDDMREHFTDFLERYLLGHRRIVREALSFATKLSPSTILLTLVHQFFRKEVADHFLCAFSIVFDDRIRYSRVLGRLGHRKNATEVEKAQ